MRKVEACFSVGVDRHFNNLRTRLLRATMLFHSSFSAMIAVANVADTLK